MKKPHFSEYLTRAVLSWCYVCLQGTLVMLQLLPYSLSTHNYGPDALDFKPQRWVDNTMLASGTSDDVGASTGAAAAAGVGAGGPPDPITFLTGPRDW